MSSTLDTFFNFKDTSPKRILLIGLGDIGRYHAAAIHDSNLYQLCGVCDINPDAAKGELYADLPYFAEYGQAIKVLRPDVVVVATPPATHRKIAEECAQQGIVSFVEKPLADTTEDCQFFFSEQAQTIVPICHNIYGEEMLWFYQYVQLQRITSLSLRINDDYCTASSIQPKRLPLGGCWMDSAPNAFALIDKLLPIKEMKINSVEHVQDTISHLPIESKLEATTQLTNISLHISWREGKNEKITQIEADGHQYQINHTEQAIYKDGINIFAYRGEERLKRHYTNFYSLCPMYIPQKETLRKIYDLILSNK